MNKVNSMSIELVIPLVVMCLIVFGVYAKKRADKERGAIN
jgi:hypothetical protein